MTSNSGSPLGKALLRSMAQDAPSLEAKRKTLLALGLAPVLAGAATVATATTSAAATSTATSSLTGGVTGSAAAGAGAKGAITSLLSAAKPLLIGVFAGAVAVGGAHIAGVTAPGQTANGTPAPALQSAQQKAPIGPSQATWSSTGSADSAEPAPQAPQSTEKILPRPVSPQGTPNPRNVESAVSVARSTSTPSLTVPAPPRAQQAISAPSTPSELAFPDSQLSQETRAVGQIRGLIASGRLAPARTALDQYDRSFPNGLLRPEASVLRIELLAKEGNSAGARALAVAFEAAHPKSSHLEKIHALVAAPLAPQSNRSRQ